METGNRSSNGEPPVPGYANTFMAEFDEQIQILSTKYNENNKKALPLLKLFLDDYISLFVGSTKKLHELLKEINQINS